MNWPAEARRDPADVRLLDAPDGPGIDAATARLYRQIVRSDRLYAVQPTRPTAGVTVVVMPGAFHGEHAHTGADGRRVLRLAAELGCGGEAVPVGSFDPLAVNADRLADHLVRRPAGPAVVVSLSKGGADVRTAIARRPEAFASVGVWVSLSGLLTGTPLVGWLRRRPHRWWAVRGILWWRGHPVRALQDIAHDGGPLAGPWPPVPPRLRLVQVVGFPLRRHLAHPWAVRGHARLSRIGPNDGGGLLLADVLRAPGQVYPVWGADHYLRPTAWDADPLLRAILGTAVHQAAASAT